jgi:hypothetical protein
MAQALQEQARVDALHLVAPAVSAVILAQAGAVPGILGRHALTVGAVQVPEQDGLAAAVSAVLAVPVVLVRGVDVVAAPAPVAQVGGLMSLAALALTAPAVLARAAAALRWVAQTVDLVPTVAQAPAR